MTTRRDRPRSQRVALRVARRTSVRSLGRSALVVALIGLPIAGIASAALVLQSTVPTTAETLATTLGHAQARLNVVSGADPDLVQDPMTGMPAESGEPKSDPRDPSRYLPAGTRVAPVFATSATVSTVTGVATLDVFEGRPWDAMLRGHFDVTDGRVPADRDEIMLNRSALERIGVRVGQTVDLPSPVGRTVRVVGVLENRAKPASTPLLFATTGGVAATSAARILQTDYYLGGAPVPWSEVRRINAQGATVYSRDVVLHPPAHARRAITGLPDPTLQYLSPLALVAVFAAFEVVLLAGAAFAVTARQQQRTLAIVASVGATRGTIARIVSAGGLVLGLVGGVVGVGAGIGLGALIMALSGDGDATRYYGFHLAWWMVAGLVAFATLVGWAAALVPAVNASRLDVVGALRGSRRPARVSRARPVVGVILLIAGAAATLGGGAAFLVIKDLAAHARPGGSLGTFAVAGVIAGPLLAQIGLGLCGGVLVAGVARLFGRVGLGSRLALRDAARNSARTVPAVMAILSTTFVAVFAMCLVGSSQVTADRDYAYATMPGEVRSLLLGRPAVDGDVRLASDPKPYVAALTDNLPVRRPRVLSNVPDFDAVFTSQFSDSADGPHAPVPTKLYPVLSVPAQNLCPGESRSPEFAATQRPGFDPMSLGADPRCSNQYTTYATSAASYGGRLWVGDLGDLELLLGHAPSAPVRAAFLRGDAVALRPEYLNSGSVEIDWWTGSQLEKNSWADAKAPPGAVDRVPAVLAAPAHLIGFGVLLPRATAQRLDLPYAPSTVLAATTRQPTDAELDAARQATGVLTGDAAGSSLTFENGPDPFADPVAWILLAISALITVAAAAVAVGLARVEGRQDDATLQSIGAGRFARRSFAFAQALTIAGLGCVLGTVAGVLPALALELPGSGAPFSPPWAQIGTGAILLPVLIAAVNWVATRPVRGVSRRAPIG